MKDLIKYWSLLIISVTVLASATQAQTNKTDVCSDARFNTAYYEFSDMLDGKQPLSIKRAVFLVEWAYLDGKLNYKDYCQQIDTTANAIKRFITANHLNRIPTGKNVAIFEYFARPYAMNGNKPFTYDFNDIAAQEDFINYFVTKVMRTHTGQCRSLPMYYKILANEIEAEAHITLAPQHLFIRHPHEKDPNQWRNVELTTQSLSREIFYIEHFGITDEMIRNKVYMNPLSDKETIAYLLSELTLSYTRKYQKEDEFVSLTSETSLTHFPQNIIAHINLCNAINRQLASHFESNGNTIDEQAISINTHWSESNARLQKLGFRKMSDETYKRLLDSAIQSMRDQGISEENIKIKTNKLLEADKSTSLKNTP